ncbi:MAG: IS701 family transposase, partial [Anaerolineaceae bacterium]|nr:IS701 family transposase [Anaerolineaceae bacterium]MDX9865608.1 IS701 family transposase [Anaerolineaceae bacterium]MDX9866138.1 IS701 family transposase [Anaerolineaceae bacterium]
KLERLKIKQKLNHFALRASLYIKATRSAFDELQALKAA